MTNDRALQILRELVDANLPDDMLDADEKAAMAVAAQAVAKEKKLKNLLDAASSAEIGLSNGKGSVPFIISMLHGALVDLGIDNRKSGRC